MASCDEIKQFLLKHLAQDIEAHESKRYREIGSSEPNTPSLEECGEADEEEHHRLSIAIDFWDRWQDARNHGWAHYRGVEEKDWPAIARQICQGLSEQWEPDRMMDNFVFNPPPLPPRTPLWQRVKNLFGG